MLTSTIAGNSPIKKMINHIIFLIDASSSMRHHLQSVKSVFDSTLQSFKSTQSPDQDINISLYQFGSNVEKIIFNKNINELNTSISFSANGMTALRDAIDISIKDHMSIKSTANEDHSFLIYAITDGQDNISNTTVSMLKTRLNSLGDEWTVASLVPSITDSHHAKTSGIPAGNIQIWDTTSNKGFEEVGMAITQSYANYSTQRSAGVRSSSNIFSVNTDNLTKKDIKKSLDEVAGDIYHYDESDDILIKDLAERETGTSYVKGTVYYELVKLEIVQASKSIVIVNKNDGRKYGGSNARSVLGLPSDKTKMKPGDFGEWRIFIQSSSYTRKIKQNTSIFVVK